MELSWSAITGAARYDLFVWDSILSSWQRLGGTSLTGTTYTHAGVTAGVTYWYTVRAVNADDEPGPYSSRLSVSVPV